MNKKLCLSLLILLILAISGCSTTGSSTTSTQKGASPASQAGSGLGKVSAEPGSSYLADFKIEFRGAKPWIYQLTSRKTAKLSEETLHIEGIDKAQNPGDIRQVTDGTNTWMIGAGTDNECVQFPNNQGMDTAYIRPEDLLPLDKMNSQLKYIGEEQVAGKKAAHYAAQAVSIGNWKNAHVDIWRDPASKGLLRLTMGASGEDPFFKSGAGTIEASYLVKDFGKQAIEPVQGCEISVPVLTDAQKLVRLPGMSSFETQTGIAEVVSFYQTELVKQKWVEKEAPSQSEGATILSFSRGAENVEIHLEALASGGSKVKLLFLQGQ